MPDTKVVFEESQAGFLQLNGILGKQGASFSWENQLAFCNSTAFSESREQVSHGKICVRMHIQTSTAYESIP